MKHNFLAVISGCSNLKPVSKKASLTSRGTNLYNPVSLRSGIASPQLDSAELIDGLSGLCAPDCLPLVDTNVTEPQNATPPPALCLYLSPSLPLSHMHTFAPGRASQACQSLPMRTRQRSQAGTCR